MIRARPVETPWGMASFDIATAGGQRAAVLRGLDDGAAARAAIYGAKLLGIERVVEVVAATPLDRLLPERGYLVPHDLLDLTDGEHLTFFTNKGYGFLPQHSPFCPELRAAFVPAVRTSFPRSAGRGVFAAGVGKPTPSQELLDMARRWGAHAAGDGVSPTTFLARELELCYMPLCMLGEVAGEVENVILAMLRGLPPERACGCAHAMQATRERGLVGDDWQTWL